VLNFDQFQVLTFDCYGTLIDWETGILSAIKPILSENEHSTSDDEILSLYAQYESEAEIGNYINYKDVLKNVAHRLATKYQIDLPVESEYFLSESIKNWLPFPDTVDAEEMIRSRKGYSLLKGMRGKEAADESKIVIALQRLSKLVLDFDEIAELDINPFLVRPKSKTAVALDARIQLT